MGSQIFGGGSSAPINPDTTFEPIGFGTSSPGTTITAGAANTKGSATAMGTTANDWSALTLYIGQVSGANNRYLVDISFDGGATWAIANLYFTFGSTSSVSSLYIPFAIGAGADIRMRCQSNSAAATIVAAIEGVVSGPSVAPGFTICDDLSADTANTRPGTINVPFHTDAGAAWTQLISPTANEYGALLVGYDGNGTTFGTARGVGVVIATGAGGAEVEYGRSWGLATTSATTQIQRGRATAYAQSIPAGERISADVRAATPGTDNARIGLHGLRN